MLQRPQYLTNRQVAGLDSFIGGLGIAQPPRISIKDDRFTLLDETGMTLADATLSVDVVIVGVNKNASRIFYDKSKPYDPTNHEAPLCWSDNGVGPSKACSAPQAPTCAACPNAVWGSATGQAGKPIPACGTIKKLAVLVSGQDGLFLMNVPPGSLGSFKQYIGSLAKMPASPEELVTRVKIENKELLFDAVDWVPENYMKFIETTIENDDAASIVNRHDEARDPNEFRALPAPNTGSFQDPPQTGLSQVRQLQPQPPANVASAQMQVGAQPPARRPPGRPPKQAPVQELSPPQPQFVPPPQMRATPPNPNTQFGSLPSQRIAAIQPTLQQTVTAPQQPPGGFGFGMQQQPAAPDPGVQGMLDRAFNLPRRT